jgi:carbon-monoxide dehydrogenase small subunit
MVVTGTGAPENPQMAERETMKKKIHMRVNGKDHELEVPTNRLLLDVLRYDLGLTGSKEGCSVGVCGACTVLMDGEMVSSCLAFAVFADGHEITTVEGLAENGELHPVQKSFIKYGGFQCGICTPGQVVAAKALLDRIPRPTEEQIKDWMMGNLCRCTGYYKIIESIQKAHQLSK